MNDVMTLPEIVAAFPSEWVLIGDPQTDRFDQLQRGTVLWHSKDRDEVYHKASEVPHKLIEVYYTGPIPAPGTAILL
jgi:hypothetical protein